MAVPLLELIFRKPTLSTGAAFSCTISFGSNLKIAGKASQKESHLGQNFQFATLASGTSAGEGLFSDRTANAFFVPKSEIEENAFDLSIIRYKEIVHDEEQYDTPKVILGRLKKLEAEIAQDLTELERMLG